MKILIADDEKNIAEGIKTILLSQELLKCQIITVDNGKDALNTARKFLPDLIITDIRMHYMNGLELVQALKEANICCKVIIISGYDKFEYAQTALRYNVVDYLLKPIDKQELLSQVTKVWEELPQNYAAVHAQLPDFPFFKLDLDNSEYPNSLKKIIQYIRQNYMNEISLQSLSDELMLHPNYISSLINKHTNIGLNELLDYVRLKKSCELLLLEPNMTISEISYLAGYNNERRLYNAFKKLLNCTPGDFRKQNG